MPAPRFLLAIVVTAAIALAVAPGVASSQANFQWPEKAENLEVLPKDFAKEDLRAVMTGFTRALGVRCSHCHMGEEGQPLSSYDFASDENPKKDVARAMLRMLTDVNAHLDQIEPSGPSRVNMWCHTCHRGRPRPMALEEELTEIAMTEDMMAAVNHYNKLYDEYYGRGAYDFGVDTLNRLGYQLMADDDPNTALIWFQINAQKYPDSPSPYFAMGEAYLNLRQRHLAVQQFERALEAAPGYEPAIRMLQTLRDE